jgi:hypothetical protein
LEIAPANHENTATTNAAHMSHAHATVPRVVRHRSSTAIQGTNPTQPSQNHRSSTRQ